MALSSTINLVCGKLLKGLDLNCIDFHNKYYQNIVLINKEDIQSYNITSDNTKNRIMFSLKPDKTGYLFTSGDAGSSMAASFNKSEKDGITYYKHNIQLPIVGVSENSKTLLKQLDKSNCFAAIHFRDGTVEIYGFNNLLKTTDYNYEAQSTLGGASIPMESKFDEYDPPYIYYPENTNDPTSYAITHFNNLFANIPDVDTGDFNNDFNNDFFID